MGDDDDWKGDVGVLDSATLPGQDDNQLYAQVYLAGKLAHQQGYAAGSNPYVITRGRVMSMGWMAGWMDGLNEAINAVTVPHVPGRRAVKVS